MMTKPWDEMSIGERLHRHDMARAAEEEAASSRFASTLLLRSELRTMPQVEPLVEGVLSRRSAALLVGATGAGKTFTALSWACSVGTGHPWLGRAVHRTPALYVVGEGASGLDARVSAWEQAWRTKVGDEDVVFSRQPQSLANRSTWMEMTAEAQERGVGLVVLDTFSSLAPDADETKEAAQMTRRLADLSAAIDGTALLVHHPGWSDNTRSRGGYQLEANVDEVLVLSGNSDDDVITLWRKKVKEGEGGQRHWLRRRPLGGSIVIEAASADEASVPLRTRILSVLADMGEDGATSSQLRTELGLADTQRSTLTKALRGLVDEGAVVKEGRRRYEHYVLARR